MSSIKISLTKTIKKLKNLPTPRLDAEILLAHATGKDKEFLHTHPEYELTQSEEETYSNYIEMRVQREPVAYITNHKEFYGLDFYVDENVLIPRPETENIVGRAIDYIDSHPSGDHPKGGRSPHNITVIDIGTGSGCIVISLAKNITQDNVLFHAIDISEDTLKIAKKNARTHGVGDKITFYEGNLLEPVLNKEEFFKNKQVIVTANLPYITPEKFHSLEPEIKKHEPKLALLTPGVDAYYYYKKLDEQIEKLKKQARANIHTFYEPPS